MLFIISLLWTIVAVALQVLLFNHLSLCGGIALIYLIPLLRMPFGKMHVLNILLGFVVGLTIDIFSNTLGMHCLVATTTMFVREILLDKVFVTDPDLKKTGFVDADHLGISTISRYAITCISMHCLLLYLVESFSLFNIEVLLLKVIISVMLTFAIMLAIEFAVMKR